jgi:hypothetical protein
MSEEPILLTEEKMIETGEIKLDEDPGPKIRPPKQIGLKKYFKMREQVFLDHVQVTQKVVMSDRHYTKASDGWRLIGSVSKKNRLSEKTVV